MTQGWLVSYSMHVAGKSVQVCLKKLSASIMPNKPNQA